MTKVTPINKESYSPRLFLAELMEGADNIEKIITIAQDDKGTVRIAHSHVSLEELCFLQKVLEDHIADKIRYMDSHYP